VKQFASTLFPRLILTVLTISSAALAADPTFETYARFLDDYVCPEGVVYSRIGGDSRLDAIAGELAAVTQAQFDALAKSDQIAFLLNAYNYHTVALIVGHYPLKTGIRDIEKPWDKKFVTLFGARVSLNHIEHELLRKRYDEPRIHFALNCASKGCPPLAREPYRGAELDRQLDRAANEFLSDTTRNRVQDGKLWLSQILDWYGADFEKKYGNFDTYVTTTLKLDGKYKVKFLEYDWSLNEAPPCTKQRE
jgi:hypothetical protein